MHFKVLHDKDVCIFKSKQFLYIFKLQKQWNIGEKLTKWEPELELGLDMNYPGSKSK